MSGPARARTVLRSCPPLPGRSRPVSGLRRVLADERVRVGLFTGAAVLVMIGTMFAGPAPGPIGLVAVTIAGAMAAAVLGSPTLAALALLVASFLRAALNIGALPTEPMVLAVCALMVSAGLAWLRGRLPVRVGGLELAMAAYLGWNLLSIVWPHSLPAVEPGTGDTISTYRFVLTGTVVPFLAFVVGRAVFRDGRRIRLLLLSVVVLAGWSGAVSIVAVTGPAALVWPSYVSDSPIWPGRAVGIVNQPAVNGLLLVAGFLIAVFMLHRRDEKPATRLALGLCALVCVGGVYLTYTRAVWVVFGLGVVMCALFARGVRTGFVLTIATAVAFIAATWSTFVSSDREAGGVGSVGEVEDRLNTIATSLWAIGEKPVMGWGIGRFTALNTYFHKVWDPSISFERGFAIASHENELGIGAELGLPGLALWILVLVLVALLVVRALRTLPATELHGRPLGLLAVTLFAAWLVSGFTVDLRYLDFANLIVFLVIGAAVGCADVQRPARPPTPDDPERAGVQSSAGSRPSVSVAGT